tara:strand:- start:2604 stop:2975 length:372 start_codon:yes stop_codon:yes gene_type:complete
VHPLYKRKPSPTQEVNTNMSWIFLVIAGLLEIGWAIGLKYTEGWSRVGPSVLTILTMIASFYCLAIAIKDIPIGTGYAIWTGIGAVGTAILGIILLGESASPMRIACIGVVILGIIGLKITAA